ncbi:MAG: pyridoxamine 5'-phosphate oxidase [Alphaproteobacteria bacterium]|nr:pyridoxamine 5'-phosphate oxidase [Alphaproteobacteria bacterium]
MFEKEEKDPIALFTAWFEEACASEPKIPDAVALATVGKDGAPSARMVLLKAVDGRGFVFYTNLESDKARELRENPRAALCFYWKSLDRQVRVSGRVEPVSEGEADAYFATRDRLSQIGAWASKQSRPLEGRLELEKRVAEFTLKFGVGAVPRPDFWSGYRVVPERIEFWSQAAFRLHDRLVYDRDGDGWQMKRLYP